MLTYYSKLYQWFYKAFLRMFLLFGRSVDSLGRMMLDSLELISISSSFPFLLAPSSFLFKLQDLIWKRESLGDIDLRKHPMFKYLEPHIFTEPPTFWKYNKELSKYFIVVTICQLFKKIILRPIILFTLTQYSMFPLKNC